MATRKAPEPTSTKGRFTAVTEAGYHYPDGFIAVGQSVALTKEQAERGLAAGLLTPTPSNEEN